MIDEVPQSRAREALRTTEGPVLFWRLVLGTTLGSVEPFLLETSTEQFVTATEKI